MVGVRYVVCLLRRKRKLIARLAHEAVQSNEDLELYLESHDVKSSEVAQRYRRTYEALNYLVRRGSSMLLKTRILVSMWQVICSMSVVYSISFPGLVQSTIERVGAYVFLEVAYLVPLRCLYPMDFVGQLILRSSAPLILFVFLAAAALHFQRAHRRRLARQQSERPTECLKAGKAVRAGARCKPTGYLPTYAPRSPSTSSTGSSSVSASIFQFFACEAMDGDGGRHALLKVDVSVDCDAHGGGALPYVLLVLCIYPIGVPAAYIYLVLRNWKTLDRLRRIELESLELRATAELRRLRKLDDRRSLAASAQNKRVSLRATLNRTVSVKKQWGRVRKRLGGTLAADTEDLDSLQKAQLQQLRLDYTRVYAPAGRCQETDRGLPEALLRV